MNCNQTDSGKGPRSQVEYNSCSGDILRGIRANALVFTVIEIEQLG